VPTPSIVTTRGPSCCRRPTTISSIWLLRLLQEDLLGGQARAHEGSHDRGRAFGRRPHLLVEAVFEHRAQQRAGRDGDEHHDERGDPDDRHDQLALEGPRMPRPTRRDGFVDDGSLGHCGALIM
jgi:hypothetical protein